MSDDNEEPVPAPEASEPRLVGIYGDINEENSSECLNALLSLHHDREPMEVIICTGGGSIGDMFAIYDTIRMTREDCEVNTRGIGRVMSAGVLLLAAGTKGKRKIGKHTRVMLHSVLGGDYMSGPALNSVMKEIETLQHMMFVALAEETNMTVEYLTGLVEKNVDHFFSAEEAVELGIADIIV
tara:strand:+ start:23418 stop:23966 length:549 start_codon:yes stop_codon:yes gene_type:complete